MKNIVHQNADGSIAVTILAPEYINYCYGLGMTDQQILDSEARSVIPAGATRLPDTDSASLPDGNFQEAWKFDTTSNSVVMDTAKQSSVQWKRVRLQRDMLLNSSDPVVRSQQAKSDTGKTNYITDWKNYQQALRDVPETQTDPFNIVWPTKPANT